MHETESRKQRPPNGFVIITAQPANAGDSPGRYRICHDVLTALKSGKKKEKEANGEGRRALKYALELSEGSVHRLLSEQDCAPPVNHVSERAKLNVLLYRRFWFDAIE